MVERIVRCFQAASSSKPEENRMSTTLQHCDSSIDGIDLLLDHGHGVSRFHRK